MSDKSRRKLLKSIAAGSGAIVAGKSLPESWSKPVVDSVMLPAHAQTSPGEPECNESIVYTNIIDAGTGFVIPWPTTYLDSTPFGYSPTAGATSMSSNNVEPGLAYLPLPNTLVPGIYRIDLDVGNYNNNPLFVTIENIGLRSGGTFMSPSASSTPTPASGEQITWSFTYNLSASDIASLDFAVDIPGGANANGSYDNLIMTKICP